MPTVALLSDIHANLHALTHVMDEVRALGIDQVVFCGDIVGYGPHSVECVKLVRQSGGVAILGNHDSYVVKARRQPGFIPAGAETLTNPVWAGIHHAAKHLDAEAVDWLESLPMTTDIPGAIVAHAALHRPEQWPYLLGYSDARPTLELMERAGLEIGFFGHTHRQEWFSLRGTTEPEELEGDRFQLVEDNVCAVVVGSVGQPRTGDPRAAWTLWDSDARVFEFRRTEYPYQQTAREIIEAGLPESSARRLFGRV